MPRLVPFAASVVALVIAMTCFTNASLVHDDALRPRVLPTVYACGYHTHSGETRVFREWLPDADWLTAKVLSGALPTRNETSRPSRQLPGLAFARSGPTPLAAAPLRMLAISADALRSIGVNTDDLGTASGGASSTAFTDFVRGAVDCDRDYDGRLLCLAHRYGGHQFGSWAAQLGDGRALLLAEKRLHSPECTLEGGSRPDCRAELQLKGSGQTPFSRLGDGRAVLRSSVREFLAAEAVYALGVPTSRAAAVVSSGDRARRDPLYNGTVLDEPCANVLRYAPSWFRIGSLEIADNKLLLNKLVSAACELLFDGDAAECTPADVGREVAKRTGRLVAAWNSIGFAHGVGNTDNFALLGVTIDYGPFGFMEAYDDDFTPNLSDDEGQYRFGAQHSVGIRNVRYLAAALARASNDGPNALSPTLLEAYQTAFEAEYYARMATRLFVAPTDTQVVDKFIDLLRITRGDFNAVLRGISEVPLSSLHDSAHLRWYKSRLPRPSRRRLWALESFLDAAPTVWWQGWLRRYESSVAMRCGEHSFVSSYCDGMRRRMMQRSNPLYVLRNYMAEEAIRELGDGDGPAQTLHALQSALANPFEVNHIAELRGWSYRPPTWANEARVSCSS
jgi:uncharacterized protein YdiU (UPF0061 family)